MKECGKRGLIPGIHCCGADGAVRAINMGFKLVTISNESGLMMTYAKRQVDADAEEFRRQGVELMRELASDAWPRAGHRSCCVYDTS